MYFYYRPYCVYLELDASGTYKEQRVSIPDVQVQGVKSQVMKEAPLLARSEETIVHFKLELQARRS